MVWTKHIPTHTDQYIAFALHHQRSVKCAIGKCLFDWSKRLVTKASVITGEKKHLLSPPVSNWYPSSLVQKITKARTAPRREPIRTSSLRSHLVRPKDTRDPAKQDGIVYSVPCECSKVYIGETGRPMPQRIKEYDRDTRLAYPDPRRFWTRLRDRPLSYLERS